MTCSLAAIIRDLKTAQTHVEVAQEKARAIKECRLAERLGGIIREIRGEVLSVQLKRDSDA